MNYRPMHSKLLAPVLTGLLAVPALAAGSIALLSPAVASASVSEAACRIYAIEASPEGDGSIPKNLEFLADQLRAPQFAAYKSFTLIGSKDMQLQLDKVAEHRFKSGHVVKLSLLGGDEKQLELRTELLRSNTSLLTLDFGIKPNAIILIPVQRGDSAVIFGYQCKG